MLKRRIISESGLLLAAILAVAAIIVVNVNITSLRLDLTENKLFTLSDGTINIINSLEEPITLDLYFSRKTLLNYPGIINYGNRVRDLLGEYAAKSGGMIELTVIEPEAFSEEEDQAVASGLQGVPVNNVGDLAYFGLLATNSTDDERVIPFFQTERESSLEYDLTKLVYNLAYPDKRTIGVISSLAVFGGSVPPMNPMMMMQQAPPSRPWAIINAMKEFFEVRDLGAEPDSIDDEVDVLMIIHPKDLTDETLFAIDQFVLNGGNAMVFVDSLAEADSAQPNPQNQMVMPKVDSDLKTLFDVWGIEVSENQIVGDIKAAMRVQTQGPRGPQEVLYLPWLGIQKNNLNADDFTTNELGSINMGTVGAISKSEESPLEIIPLIQTSEETMMIDRDLVRFQQNPGALLQSFASEGKVRTLAARFSGHVNSAFPEGLELTKDEDSSDEQPKQSAEHLKEGDINVIVVADTDILSDRLWVRVQSFFGMEIPQTLADNGTFVINSLDNLSGNNDLISLRSRGESARPFTRVEEIRRLAENEFREQEQQLQSRLEEMEQRIVALQEKTGGSGLILSPEQTREIEKFREEQVKTRKELRTVQHELQRNIEKLGTQLKFFNIGLVPLLIMLIAVATSIFRSRKHV